MNLIRRFAPRNAYFWMFATLLAFYCIWVLTLPLFPSLDGSLHLYYASVLGSLLSGSRQYSTYYFIRHVLPPYALQYYLLIVTAHFFGYVIAEKLLVCVIFTVTAIGFRYLATYLGPSGDLASLLIIPLLLNWPLGMGFYSYCLSVGIALWALGMWYRAVDRRSHGLWLGFLAMTLLMVLTHPVPVLFVYALVGIDVGWRIISKAEGTMMPLHPATRSLRWDLCYALLSWSGIFYIVMFMGKHRVVANLLQTYDRKDVFIKLAKLSTLAMFSGSHPLIVAYRASLYTILILAIASAAKGARRRIIRKNSSPADVILISSLLLLIAIPIMPPVMNGANYFSQRLVLLVWLGTLAAASKHPRLLPKRRMQASILASVYALCVLVFGNALMRPTAVQLSTIERQPTRGRKMTGLILSLPDAPNPDGLNYVPYYWAGARYFRRSRSNLLNGGWLYEYYLPLGSRLEHMTDKFTPAIQDSPGDAYQLLLNSQIARAQVMPNTNMVVFTGRESPSELLKILGRLDESGHGRSWTCEQEGWYSVCVVPHSSVNRK